MRTEAELIGAVQGGDQRAFRELYRLHTPAMYAMALRLLARNAADAEDAIQEAWLRAVRGLGGFRGAQQGQAQHEKCGVSHRRR